jgi:hypothetical protein
MEIKHTFDMKQRQIEFQLNRRKKQMQPLKVYLMECFDLASLIHQTYLRPLEYQLHLKIEHRIHKESQCPYYYLYNLLSNDLKREED